MKPLALISTLAGIMCVAPLASVSGQEIPAKGAEAANGTLRVFLDCHTRGCDFDHFRREITFVAWVRDRQDADVHVLVTAQRTGTGGTELTLDFMGLRAFDGQRSEVMYISGPDNTRDEFRDGFTRMLKIGLAGYAASTATGAGLSILYQPIASSDPLATPPEEDPWNYWVFRLSVRGSIDGESQERFWSGNASVSASRVTEALKIVFSARANGNRSEFDVVDTTEGLDTTFVSTRTNYSFDALSVWSLGAHWSTGVLGEFDRNSQLNWDFAVRVGPAIEYNIFPYEESTRREITFRYSAGLAGFDYVEETIFDQTSEVRPAHALQIDLGAQEPWGRVYGEVEAFQYLHDLARHSLTLSGGLNVRIFRGLDFNVGGRISRVKDQLYLSKAGLTPEEILLRQRARETDFRYGMNIGMSYRFGSAFNNVVNPRMWR
jgi:hypothetical protein